METPRRNFLQALAGAAALPLWPGALAPAAAAAPALRDSRLMGEAKFIDVDGIRTRYFDAGSGEPLVLIHGGQWPATSSAGGWAPIFDHLAARFHVYAFDKLGMGYTDNPKTDADYSMAAVVRHAHGFIKSAGITRAVVLGHSRGALPAARIAIDDPGLVSHLVILDTNALASDEIKIPDRPDPPPVDKLPTREEIRQADLASRLSVQKDFITDAYVEGEYEISRLPKLQEADKKFRALRDQWIREHPEEMKANPMLGNNMGAVVWWMIKEKHETLDLIRAGRLKAPTVIIWGWNDTFAPYALGLDTMNTIAKVNARTEMHFVNQCGHFIASEHPEQVTKLIEDFVFG
jgi:2-hydroxy-6-oxo-6-(2'-carboxyphenyl)-hexa-2,4-dienoate hydrolase